MMKSGGTMVMLACAGGLAVGCGDRGGLDVNAADAGAGADVDAGTDVGVQKGPFMSGVDPNKILGDLTPGEVTKICQAGETFIAMQFNDARVVEIQCRLIGVFAASLLGANIPANQAQLACVLAYAQCKNAPPAAAPDGGTPVITDPNMCQPMTAGCTLTVAEYEQCLTDAAGLVDRLATSIPGCEQVGAAGAMPLDFLAAIQPPASCTAADAKCPGLNLFGGIMPGAGLGMPLPGM